MIIHNSSSPHWILDYSDKPFWWNSDPLHWILIDCTGCWFNALDTMDPGLPIKYRLNTPDILDPNCTEPWFIALDPDSLHCESGSNYALNPDLKHNTIQWTHIHCIGLWFTVFYPDLLHWVLSHTVALVSEYSLYGIYLVHSIFPSPASTHVFKTPAWCHVLNLAEQARMTPCYWICTCFWPTFSQLFSVYCFLFKYLSHFFTICET